MGPRTDDADGAAAVTIPSFVVDDDLLPPPPPVTFDPPAGGLTPAAFRVALLARASAEEAIRKEREAAEAAEAAALAAGTCPYFLEVTGLGRCDTDGLIPTLFLAAALAAPQLSGLI